jgi:hypothetical protein
VAVEEKLYDAIDQLVTGQPVAETVTTLRALAGAFPAGEALARRRAAEKE